MAGTSRMEGTESGQTNRASAHQIGKQGQQAHTSQFPSEDSIAVFGTKEFNLGFMLAGIKKVFNSGDDPDNEFRALASDHSINMAVIEDDVARKLSPMRRRIVETSIKPVFVTLSKSMSDDALKQMIKRSIGVDLWK
ncbi:V-type ATP synthase subunit F [Candidatus Woesearchaeota archaeon]|nr:V-type ATP synthase subunit F [Candidatus Woesearchaeota archaeon]